jgi:hypothetical protein
MSEKLRKAYERLRIRQIALAALSGQPYIRVHKWMERQLDEEQQEEHLRRVADRVVPECPSRRQEYFASHESGVGWYTNDQGDSWKDGDGLVWGVVFQLPARKGKARFIAGYEFGGCDFGIQIDRTRIFEGKLSDNDSYEKAGGNPAAREAAQHADELAEEAADKEREYQREWEEPDVEADQGQG